MTASSPASPLRVAVVHSFYTSANPSGENSAVRSQVAALERMGHDVTLISTSSDRERERSGRGYVFRAASRVATGRGQSPLDTIRQVRPDVVYVHNLFPNYGRRWALEVEQPLVAVVHNYRPLCVNGFLFRQGQVCTLCPDGSPWSGVQYACYRDSRIASLPLAWANHRGPDDNMLFQAADRIVLLSELQREVYARAGLPTEKVVVMPNFLPDSLDPGPGDGPGAEQRRDWVFIGRLSEEKGVVELVRRWPAGHPLRILGEGPCEGDVAAAAAGKDIAMLGVQPRDKVIDLLRRSRGMVFSSLWYEGFPLVYIEALAAGTPVLAVGPSVVGRLVEEEGTGASADWENLDGALGPLEEKFTHLNARCRGVFDDRYTESAFQAKTTQLHESLGLVT